MIGMKRILLGEKEKDVWSGFKRKRKNRWTNRNDVIDLFDLLDENGGYPIEILAKEHESSAMGFITVDAANELEFDYEKSGLNDFIAGILDDMEKESNDCRYEFKGIKIWLSR